MQRVFYYSDNKEFVVSCRPEEKNKTSLPTNREAARAETLIAAERKAIPAPTEHRKTQ